MAAGVLLTTLAWAWLERAELAATRPTTGQVMEVTDVDGVRIARVRVDPGGEVRLFLPHGRPSPAPGDNLALLLEEYDDGSMRYRVDPDRTPLAFPAGSMSDTP